MARIKTLRNHLHMFVVWFPNQT